jgi:hypothetical protein
MSIVTAVQYPAVEYGCTQDAVCRLLAKVDRDSTDASASSLQAQSPQSFVAPIARSKIQVLLQVDQWGIVHAPFAVARSALVEHGHDDCSVIVATTIMTCPSTAMPHNDPMLETVRIEAVVARALAPMVPDIF